MREMKDSGIEWIGIIPKGWNISRLKYIAKFFNGDRGKNYPSSEDLVDDGIAFLTSNNIHGIVLDCSQEKSKFITEERYNRLGGAKIQLNDIAFCLRGSVGNCAINKTLTKGTVASSLMIIRPIKASSDFINYVLQTDVCDVQTIKAMNGSCAANLSAENVSNYYFVEPPIVEQKKIAIFLDSKCSEIDAISADIQKEIEILEQYKRSVITEAVTKGLNPDAEMKDSGVAWCPQIPSHWQYSNPKGLFGLRTDRAFRDDRQLTASQEYGIVYQDEYMEKTGNKVVTVTKDFSILKHVEPDDFVISMRSFQGGLEYSDKRGCISSAYVMLIPNKEFVYAPFYRWFFKSSKYINALQSTSNLVRDGQAMRYANFVKVPLFIVPIEEQKAIASYLDEKIEKVNSILAEKKKQLEILSNYKKSLIYEYVTGKKEAT